MRPPRSWPSASFACSSRKTSTSVRTGISGASARNSSPSRRVRFATETSRRSPQRSSYGKDGMSVMWIPAQTTVPPLPTARNARGTSSPTGAKMIAASSSSGGPAFVAPAQSAPSSSASACASSSPGRVSAKTRSSSWRATSSSRSGRPGSSRTIARIGLRLTAEECLAESCSPPDAPASLLDEREHLEHRQVHRDDDHADHQTDADHHHRLDDRGQALNGRIDLVLVEVGDLAEHLLELSGLLADLDHVADHRREDGVVDERLRDRHSLVHPRANVGKRLFDDPIAGRLARDLERFDDVHARGDERRQRAREAGDRDLEHDAADLHRHSQLEPVPDLASLLRLLRAAEAEDHAAQGREDEHPVASEEVRHGHDVLGKHRQLAAEVLEDVDEDRDEEEQHPDQDEGREDQDHRRIDHRALHAAFDLRFLLDLEGDAVEHLVEDSCGLAGFDHRDVEAAEDLGVAGHRLRKQKPALDVGPELGDDRAEVLVVGLLLEDDERPDDGETRVDHGRELARKDLEGLGLDLLEDGADALLTLRGELAQLLSQEAAHAELLACCIGIRGVDLALQLEALRVDRAVSESRHVLPGEKSSRKHRNSVSAEGSRHLSNRGTLPIGEPCARSFAEKAASA